MQRLIRIAAICEAWITVILLGCSLALNVYLGLRISKSQIQLGPSHDLTLEFTVGSAVPD